MAKSHNQKAKILYLAQMLRESGENRVLSMQEILENLLEYGIQAERKSIYDDMQTLRDFGMDIRFKRGRPGGYYLAGQTVQEIGSTAEMQDTQAEAAPDTEVSALPEQQELQEEKEFPEQKAELPAEHAPGAEWKFSRKESSGEKPIKLLCSNRLESEVKDYFGKAAEYKDKGLGYFTVTAVLTGDAQFFGWLTAMGKEIHILKPKKTAQAYRDYLKSLVKEYKGI